MKKQKVFGCRKVCIINKLTLKLDFLPFFLLGFFRVATYLKNLSHVLKLLLAISYDGLYIQLSGIDPSSDMLVNNLLFMHKKCNGRTTQAEEECIEF